MAEIINIDVITKIAATAEYQPDHGPLLAALKERYPSSTFQLATVRGEWSRADRGRAVDADGNQVAEDYRKWLTDEFHAAGDDALAVYEKLVHQKLVVSAIKGETIIIAVPTSGSPDGFLQLEIHASHEVIDRYLLDSSFPPEDLADLLDPFSCGTPPSPKDLSPWQYEFSKLTNIRRHVQAMVELDRAKRVADLPGMEAKVVQIIRGDQPIPTLQTVPYLEIDPDWLDRPMKEVRFLYDWQESSAGKSGHRLCDHWWLQLKDYVYKGQRNMSFIPQGTMRHDDLPKVDADDHGSIFSLMAALEKFDAAAGFTFAWYFFMLHGNRLDWLVGDRVVKALMAGKIGLPEHDRAVLMRWAAKQYRF